MAAVANAPAANATDVPATGVYLVDPHRSEITFATRHLFGLGKVAGSFKLRSGQVTVAEPLGTSSVTAEAETASFSTGNSMRDRQVRSSKFLDADEHPAIIFRSTGLADENGRWVLHGILAVRGHSGPFDLEITRCSATDGAFELQAVGTVDRYAFGISAMKGMAARRLQLTVTVHAIEG